MDNNVKAFVEMLPGLTDDNLLKLLGIMHAVRDGVIYNTNDPSAKQVKIAKRAGKVIVAIYKEVEARALACWDI